jgi:RNA polymerase sigma factor (sigma-70 family)
VKKLIDSHSINDDILLIQVEQGDSHAFNILYERYWMQAYNNAYKRLKDRDHAKDIVQDIFINIWLKKENHINNFPAYLNIAVRNRVFKLLEKQKVLHPFLDTMQNIPTHLQADANIRWNEFYKAYDAMLSALPAKRQIIFRLRFQENLTTKAIAEQLDLTRKTVQNQLGKAIEQLRISMLHLFSLLIALLLR